MRGEKAIRERAFARGLVYAAGWLCHQHNAEDLAEGLLESADLDTAGKCLAAGADPYDIACARPALRLLSERK